MTSIAPVTAIVTAHRRIDELLHTLRIIHACVPAPAEVIVHVDGGERSIAAAVHRRYPDLHIIVSDDRVGPGGGRNRLIAAASQPIVASFDDDSYPIDRDYFERVQGVLAQFPEAWIADAHVYGRDQAIEPDADHAEWVADFSGGGCAYRRSRFLEIGGYLPVAVAYGMEEVDVGLRLHAAGGRVLRSRQLRVFHNTDLSRHADPAITAASIANIALLAYLRYPRWLWGMAVAQCMKRIGWLLGHRRFRGIGSGVAGIPRLILRHRAARRPVAARVLRSYWSLRRHPIRVAEPQPLLAQHR